MTNKNYIIRATFLREFVKELVKNMPKKEENLTKMEKNIIFNQKIKEETYQLNQVPEIPLLPMQPQLPPLPPRTIQDSPFQYISSILRNPSVQSIECPGPEKQILVNNSGKMQVMPQSLTKEQIYEIIKKISEKTRIPIIPGVFKAAFEGLTIVAVISEFVGTRFIIQKRFPTFMPR